MKTGRLLTISAAIGIVLFVFLITSNSTILGNEKASESETKDLISQINGLQKELEVLKKRVGRLESGQSISPTLPHIIIPSHPLSDVHELPEGSVRGEAYGIPYTIIPLQDQIIHK
ncbi:MAG: hypothetical protein OXP71_09410 [Candidatus Poribacteria bacterium]|nr:hypothetical protein [Candidatus Poribacteria bacterium]